MRCRATLSVKKRKDLNGGRKNSFERRLQNFTERGGAHLEWVMFGCSTMRILSMDFESHLDR